MSVSFCISHSCCSAPLNWFATFPDGNMAMTKLSPFGELICFLSTLENFLVLFDWSWRFLELLSACRTNTCQTKRTVLTEIEGATQWTVVDNEPDVVVVASTIRWREGISKTESVENSSLWFDQFSFERRKISFEKSETGIEQSLKLETDKNDQTLFENERKCFLSCFYHTIEQSRTNNKPISGKTIEN